MNPEDKHSALIEVWDNIKESISDLKKLGFDDDRGVVQALYDAQGWLDDEINEAELDMLEDEE